MAKSLFAKKRTKAEDLMYYEERAVFRATEAILELMEEENLSKTDLAKALGKSKAYVSQALSGGRNMTLRTFASFAWACGYAVDDFTMTRMESRGAAATVTDLATWKVSAPMMVDSDPRRQSDDSEIVRVA
jgi:transcriptional regulator with XRE-family HTH domain